VSCTAGLKVCCSLRLCDLEVCAFTFGKLAVRGGRSYARLEAMRDG
jgi:hypothetical protein